MKHYQTKVNATRLLHAEPRMRVVKKTAGLIAGIISSLLLVNICVAADREDNARSRYDYERSLCENGKSYQSRETCLREAGAARQQLRSGRLTTESEDQLQRNRERRCDAHSGEDREYCLLRMRGEGTQSGTAERGGISRELTVIVKPPQ
ncbi:hypothetical protein [Undibacterium sp. TJN19]|uniref:hypothetical protein n=1 Tax=Undibacterium sp. TJN19 TaxID=3413055 RepID=UPI003BF02CF1